MATHISFNNNFSKLFGIAKVFWDKTFQKSLFFILFLKNTKLWSNGANYQSAHELGSRSKKFQFIFALIFRKYLSCESYGIGSVRESC